MTKAMIYGIVTEGNEEYGILNMAEVKIMKNEEEDYDTVKGILFGGNKILDVLNIEVSEEIFDKEGNNLSVWYDQDTEKEYLNIGNMTIYEDAYSDEEEYFYGFDKEKVQTIFDFIHKIETKAEEYFDELDA